MSIKFYAVALCALLLLPASAYAGGFCCQLSTGTQEGFSSAGQISLRLDESYSRMDRFQNGGSQVSLSSVLKDPRFAKMNGVVPDVMTMNRITATVGYAPTDRLSLNVSVPYVINDMTMFMFMAGMWSWGPMEQIHDLGDVSVTGTYRIYQDKDDHPTTAINVGAGLKLPTGAISYTNSKKKRVHAHMQPGTGSWDPILLASFTKMLSPSFMAQAGAHYEIATANGYGYKFGDTAGVDAELRYNVTDFMNVSLGVNYFHSEQADDPDNKYNGRDSKRLTDYSGYTGEDSLWVSPAVQIMPFSGASIDLKFQYPAYYHVPDIEHVTSYRIVAGISYSF